MRVSADGTHDDWRMGRNGFGADWDMAANDSVHLSTSTDRAACDHQHERDSICTHRATP
jgi:hypothetical protein